MSHLLDTQCRTHGRPCHEVWFFFVVFFKTFCHWWKWSISTLFFSHTSNPYCARHLTNLDPISCFVMTTIYDMLCQSVIDRMSLHQCVNASVHRFSPVTMFFISGFTYQQQFYKKTLSRKLKTKYFCELKSSKSQNQIALNKLRGCLMWTPASLVCLFAEDSKKGSAGWDCSVSVP